MTNHSVLPNIITISRFPLTIWFLYLIIEESFIPAIMLFYFICATDILDGMFSRILNAESRLGAYLDVFADLFFVVSSLTILMLKSVTPAWFLIVVIGEFGFFCITSKIAKRRVSSRMKPWVFDRIGKVFAIMAFISPGVFCHATIFPAAFDLLSLFWYIAFCLIVLLTILSRIKCCLKTQFVSRSKTRSEFLNLRNHQG